MLKDIDAATTITFTDRGWNDGSGFVTPLAVGDGEFTWTSGADRTAGEVITLNFATLAPSAASFTVLGDQLFAIQGTIAAPIFIAGMQLNNGTGSDDANWDGAATSNTTSALPEALATGDTAVRLLGAGGMEQDNWQFSCSAVGGCPLSGTPEEIRSILHNPQNWVSNDTTPYSPTVDVSFGSPIIADPVPPCEVSIDDQPADLSVCLTGSPATAGSMSVVATTGLGALSYQWEQLAVGASTWSEIGVTNAVLEFQVPSLSLNGAQYRVIVTSDNNTPSDDTDDCSVTSDAVTLTVNSLPTVSFTAPADLQIDAGVQAGLGGGTPAQGSEAGDTGLYGGPGVTDDGNGMTYSFDPAVAGAGTHTITYTYTNGNGCVNSASDDVEVLPAIAPCTVEIDIQPEEDIICFVAPSVRAQTQVAATGNGLLSYNWQFSTDQGGSWRDTPEELNGASNFEGLLDETSGTLLMRVIVTSDNNTPNDDNDDCSIISDEVVFEVLPSPEVLYIAPADLAIDAGVQTGLGGGTPAQGTEANDSGLYSGPGVTDDGNGMTYSFDPAVAGVGTHTITYTYTNNNGCSNSASDDVQILPVRPEISIGNVSQPEGTGGTTTMNFMVSLSEASTQTITVDYITIDGTAISPDDFTASGATTLTFDSGEINKTITIAINPDGDFEPEEEFTVELSNPVNATLADATGTGTIENDDLEGCTSPSNVALNKPSSQSSTYGNGIASFANDGNLSGSSPWDADLQHTNDDATGPWWEVDLGSDHDLEEVVIHNRTNGFQDRLSDFYVFVSDAPFSASATASDLVGDVSIWNYYFEGPAGALETIPSDVNGRYVRIQLSGQGFLHMAELEVMGCPSGPDVCEGAEPVVITAAGPFLDSGSPEQLVASPAGGTWSGQISATGLFDPSIGAGDYIITYSYTNGDGCTQSDTVTVMVDRDNDVPEPCDGSDNVALNKPASQSSTYGNGEAFYANDGNLEGGSPWSADLQHTVSGEAQPWWEVDLGSAHELTEVKIYNRTNRLQGRLNNFYIFVSDAPFSGSLLDQLGDPNIESIFFEGEAGLVESFATMATGRYVRIQLQGSGTLHMAEVEVYGCPTDPSICDGTEPITITTPSTIISDGLNISRELTATPEGGTWMVNGEPNDGVLSLALGSYNVTYSYTDSNSCTQTKSKEIIVRSFICPTLEIERVGPFNQNEGIKSITAFVIDSGDSGLPIGPIPSNARTFWYGDVINNNEEGQFGFFDTSMTPGIYEVRIVYVDGTGGQGGCGSSVASTTIEILSDIDGCTEAYNLALDGTASHSSTYGNGEAFYANDGNQSGSSPWSADLQHTLDEDSQPWWQVDLGEMATIERVVIYNRTDKLQSRLNNFYVLYSDSPFGTQSLDELLADTNIGREFFSGAAGLEEEFTVDVMARYVRVQKTGSGPLHMAEVEVYGCPFAAPSLQANLNTFNVWPNPASEDAKASFENPTNVLSLMIYDMQGRIVKVYEPSELNAGMVMDLNVNTLAPGVYIVRTEDERGIHFEKQLVIKR